MSTQKYNKYKSREREICSNFAFMNMSSENMNRLAEFITEHYGDDPDRLALQKDKWPEVDVAAAVSTLVSRRKLAGKAPVWAAMEGLVLPRTLSAEQCSGEVAARHKALAIRMFLEEKLNENAVEHPDRSSIGKQDLNEGRQNAEQGIRKWRIADLTGGLGVDCLEFSKVAEAVLYNEMLPELAEAAEHNFRVLGAGNIEICCSEASPRTLGSTGDGGFRERLETFRPDLIYLDPARRDGCGKKVFLLEDCSPDILKIKGILLEIAPVLVLKLSPMADIAMVLERLGNECRELQIIEAGGECKELLVLMRRDADAVQTDARMPEKQTEGQDVQAPEKRDEHLKKHENCRIKAYNLDTGKGGDKANESPVFEFCRDEENGCTGQRLADAEEIVPGRLLFEPGKALMKAGCFRLIGKCLDAPALGRDTHYYIMKDDYFVVPNPPTLDRDAHRNMDEHRNRDERGIVNDRAARAGKLFRILDVCEMSGKALKEFGQRHPEAEVTARSVRMTSEELRRRLRCKSSDRYHTFALHADTPDKNLLLFTERI